MKKFPPLLIASLLIFIAIAIGWLMSDREEISSTSQNKPVNEQENKQSLNTEGCSGELTPKQTEGPYYKPGSPLKNNIAEGQIGEPLIVEGFVYNQNCKPLVNAKIDFWQAGSNGEYDLAGFNLRGHQFTNENGMYRLTTIIPAAYGSRPPHIHLKIETENGAEFTSQIYFPNQTQNQIDSIFNELLIMKVDDGDGKKIGHFNFVVE